MKGKEKTIVDVQQQSNNDSGAARHRLRKTGSGERDLSSLLMPFLFLFIFDPPAQQLKFIPLREFCDGTVGIRGRRFLVVMVSR